MPQEPTRLTHGVIAVANGPAGHDRRAQRIGVWMTPTTDVQRHMWRQAAGHAGAATCRLLAVSSTASSGFVGMSRVFRASRASRFERHGASEYLFVSVYSSEEARDQVGSARASLCLGL